MNVLLEIQLLRKFLRKQLLWPEIRRPRPFAVSSTTAWKARKERLCPRERLLEFHRQKFLSLEMYGKGGGLSEAPYLMFHRNLFMHD